MRLFRRRRPQAASGAAKPAPAADTVTDVGPANSPADPPSPDETDLGTWADPAPEPSDVDAAARADGYRNAAHRAGSEKGKAERAKRSDADRIVRARSVGHVARAEYLSPEEEALALVAGADGFPDAWLERVRDRLLVVTPMGWVNPKSRTAYRAGLHSFQLRGSRYYDAALKAGRFTPGSPVRLVREPDNEHDANAVAVYAGRARSKAGYVPRGQAKRVANLLDDGAELVAVSVRGSGAGTEGTVPQILVCERVLYEHLVRHLP